MNFFQRGGQMSAQSHFSNLSDQSDLIVVTGANGFIGSQTVRALNQVGYKNLILSDWVGLSQRNLLKDTKYLRFIQATELFKQLPQIAAKQKPSWFFHIGANSSTTETDRSLLQKMNTEYSKEVFQWCTEQGTNLIYASSAATYGAGEKGFSEQTPSKELKPLNLYGESKLLFDMWVEERVARGEATPQHWYGLRYFNVYGPSEGHKGEMASVVFKAYHQILQTGQLKLFKSYRADFKHGEQKRDFIYVKQVTDWMLQLMKGHQKNDEKGGQNDKKERAPSGIYNFGMGKAETWIKLADCIFKALGKETKIEFIDMPESIRDQYQYFTQADMSKSFGVAGLSQPSWTLEKSISDYVNWLKQNS
jgi:ADP-L-glycero-D-manno-heptose 6-epimerase